MRGSAQTRYQIVLAVGGDAGDYLRDLLEHADYTVYPARDVGACLSAHKAYTPRLVMTELVMRGGDGLDAVRQLRARDPSLPILVYVPQGRDADYTRLLEAGATDCLVPPLSSPLLLRRVANLLTLGETVPQLLAAGASRPASKPAAHRPDFDAVQDALDDESITHSGVKPLPESEQRYRDLFNAAYDAITIVDSQTRRFLDVNRLATRWLGYTREELLGMTFDAIHVPLEDSEQRMVDNSLSITGQLIYRQSYRRKDGRSIPVEVSSRIIHYDGRPASLNIARDITERQAMEARLQQYTQELERAVSERTAELSRANADLAEQREQLLAVITGANCLLWSSTVTLAAGEFHWETRVYSEDAAARFLPVVGPSGGSFVAAWRESMLPEDRTRSLQTAHNALKNHYSGYTQEYGCRLADRQIRWLYEEVRIKSLSDGRWSLVGVSTDITERKRSAEMLRRAKEDLERAVAQRTAQLTAANQSLRQEIEIRQAAEKAMSESEARFRAIVEHAPEAIVVFDVTTEKYVDVNPNALKLFEATLSELLRAGPTDFSVPIQPDGRDAVEAMRQYIRMAVEGKAAVFEWLYQTPSGRRLPCEVRLLLLPTTGNLLVRGSITDITERKRQQQAQEQQRIVAQALRESAAELQRTLEMDEVYDRIIEYAARVMPLCESIAITLLSKDAQRVEIVRYQRRAAFDAALLPREVKVSDMLTMVWMLEHKQAIAIPETDHSNLWSVRLAVSDWVKSHVAAPLLAADGQVIGFISLSHDAPNYFNDDHASRLMIFANISAIAIQNARLYNEIWYSASKLQVEVAEQRTELQTERTRLNAILNALTEGVLFTDVNWNTVYSNRPLEALTGYSQDELADRSIIATLMSLPPDYAATLQNMIMNELKENGIWRYSAVIKRKDGSEFHGSLIATRVNLARGQMLGTVTVLRDVSEEKRLEQQKAQFIANASHELRTPIANMKTRLYLARRQPEKLEEHLGLADTVAERMRRLVEALLDLSRFEHGQIPVTRRVTELQPIILEVYTLQAPEAEKRGQTLRHTLPAEPLLAQVDSLRFSQVITNLVTNAIHYTPDGGQIRISLEVEPAERSGMLDVFGAPCAAAVIGVHDNGPGIPPKILPNIFKPFVRGSELSSGVGLGLAITQEIVELHHGTITVESMPGEGTHFYVRLALAERGDDDEDGGGAA